MRFKALLFCLLSFFATALVFAQSFTIEQKFQLPNIDKVKSSSFPEHFTNFQGHVFFTANDDDSTGTGISGKKHLYKHNLVTNITEVILGTNGLGLSNVSDLKLFNNSLYFKQGDVIHALDKDFTLTEDNTSIVYQVKETLEVDGNLYLVVNLGLGYELYIYNNGQAELIKDFNIGEGDGVTSNLTLYNNTIYLAVNDGQGPEIYSFNPTNGDINKITTLNPSTTFVGDIVNLLTIDNKLYFNAAVKFEDGSLYGLYGTNIYNFDFQSKEMKSHRIDDFDFTMDKVGSKIFLNGKYSGLDSDSQCGGPDIDASIALYDVTTHKLQCLRNENTYDSKSYVNYQIIDDTIIVDWVLRRHLTHSTSRNISVVNLDTNSLEVIYQPETCLDLSNDCPTPIHQSFAFANNKIYLPGFHDFTGVEPTSVSLTGDDIKAIDINTFYESTYALKPEYADQNFLYIQPYLTQQERDEYSRNYYSLSIQGNTLEHNSLWMPRTLSSAVINGKSSEYRSLGAFAYNNQIVLLTDSYYGFKIESESESVILDLAIDNYTRPNSRVPATIIDDELYFSLTHSNGDDTLYRYHFINKSLDIVLPTQNGQTVLEILTRNDKIFAVVSENNTGKIYQLTGEQSELVVTVATIDGTIKPQLIGDAIYFSGVTDVVTDFSILKFDLATLHIDAAIGSHTTPTLQSFAAFDNKLFYVLGDAQQSQMYYFDLHTQQQVLITLNDTISQPLDVIRFGEGIYFQAINSQSHPALFNLSLPEKYHFPLVDSSESVATGKQGDVYESALSISDLDGDSLEVIVVEPSWLSYDKNTQKLTGTPIKFDSSGSQLVKILVTDGHHYSAHQYPINIESTLEIIEHVYPLRAQIGSLFSHQVEANYSGDATLSYSLEFRGTGHADWLSLDEKTGMLSGQVPLTEEHNESYLLLVTVTDGSSSDSFSVFIRTVIRPVEIIANDGPLVAILGDNFNYQVKIHTINNWTYKYRLESDAPEWLNLDADTGILSGEVPTSYSTEPVTINTKVYSDVNYADYAYHTFDINFYGEHSFTNSPPLNITQGEVYEYIPEIELGLNASGDVNFSIDNKPDWAQFDTITGKLSGTPNAVGVYENIIITVADDNVASSLAAFDITVTAIQYGEHSFTNSPSLNITAGAAYEYIPVIELGLNASGEVTFSINNKPDWAQFDTITGKLSGTPVEADVYENIIITVADDNVASSLTAFDITVTAIQYGEHSFTNSPSLNITAGAAYEYIPVIELGLNASGEVTFSINNKPDWAQFDTITGKLSGTPVEAGVYENIIITVADDNVASSLAAFDITVTAEPVVISDPKPKKSSGSLGAWLMFGFLFIGLRRINARRVVVKQA